MWKGPNKICGNQSQTDTFPLNQSELLTRTETFEKGINTILVFSVQGLKHSFAQPKHCDIYILDTFLFTDLLDLPRCMHAILILWFIALFVFTVAFFVRFASDDWQDGIPESAHNTLIFDDAITNVGNGYDPHTGIFTSPSDGYYAFSLVAMVPYAPSHPALELSE